jgi:hypothetical protein
MFNSLYHSISVEIFEESRVVFPASTVSIDLRPQKSAKFPHFFCGKLRKLRKFRNHKIADENPACQEGCSDV